MSHPMNQQDRMTPDEIEVGRRNLIAELRDGEADGMDVSADMVRDLIAVLEGPRPLPTREQIGKVVARWMPRLVDASIVEGATDELAALFTGGEES